MKYNKDICPWCLKHTDSHYNFIFVNPNDNSELNIGFECVREMIKWVSKKRNEEEGPHEMD